MQIAGKTVNNFDLMLLFLVVSWFAFSLLLLDIRNLSFDEQFSVYMAKLPIAAMLKATTWEVHPPLYYLLLRGWINVFGDSDLIVRIPSIIFAAGAIVMMYVVGRTLFDKRVGVLSALVFAVSAFEFQLVQQARMYSLMTLLAITSMYFFIRFVRHGRLASAAGYVLTSTLLLYTHNYGVFIILAQNIYFLTLAVITPSRRLSRLTHWFALQALVLLLTAPWISTLMGQVGLVEQGKHTLAVDPTLLNFGYAFYLFAGSRALLVIFILLGCFAVLAYKRGKATFLSNFSSVSSLKNVISFEKTNEVYLLLLWLFTPLVVPFIVSLLSPASIFSARYSSAAAVALFILVAVGIQRIRRVGVKVGVLCIILVLSLASVQAAVVAPDPRPYELIAQHLDAQAQSGDVVLVFPASELTFGIARYNTRADLQLSSALSPIESARAVSQKDMQKLILNVSEHNRLWLVQVQPNDVPQIANYTLVKETLLTQYNVSYYQKEGGFEVYLLTREGTPTP